MSHSPKESQCPHQIWFVRLSGFVHSTSISPDALCDGWYHRQSPQLSWGPPLLLLWSRGEWVTLELIGRWVGKKFFPHPRILYPGPSSGSVQFWERKVKLGQQGGDRIRSLVTRCSGTPAFFVYFPMLASTGPFPFLSSFSLQKSLHPSVDITRLGTAHLSAATDGPTPDICTSTLVLVRDG